MKQVILFLLVLFSISATCQTQVSPVRFGVHGNIISANINATLGDVAGIPPPSSGVGIALDQVYGLGLGGGVHVDFNLGMLTLRLSGDYIRLAPDKDKFSSYVNAVSPGIPLTFEDGGIINLWSGTVNAKLVVLPLPVLQPYITGGGGLAYIKTTDATLNYAGNPLAPIQLLQSQTVGTYNLGAGVDLALGFLTIYGELKVTWVMIKEGTSTYVPIGLVGVSF